MIHIMLDLETLDVKSTAVVTAIGAAAHNTLQPDREWTFYATLTDPNLQQKHGRTIGGDTVFWWMKQSEEARLAVADISASSMATLDALEAFTDWVQSFDDPVIWGNGADFDNIILGGLYESMGQIKPWSYSQNRCYRTVKNLNIGPRKATRLGTHHNALDDARTQLAHLLQILKTMK